jgi:hypothetical protein
VASSPWVGSAGLAFDPPNTSFESDFGSFLSIFLPYFVAYAKELSVKTKKESVKSAALLSKLKLILFLAVIFLPFPLPNQYNHLHK